LLFFTRHTPDPNVRVERVVVLEWVGKGMTYCEKFDSDMTSVGASMIIERHTSFAYWMVETGTFDLYGNAFVNNWQLDLMYGDLVEWHI